MSELKAVLELITQFGVLPLLLIVVWNMKKEINELKQKMDKLNEQHKADLKSHTEEMKGIMQTWLEQQQKK